MGLSDLIAEYIRETLESGEGKLELQRADIANRFACAPSQINYVIATRFTPEHGYLVASRRGGGGYIRISRVTLQTPGPRAMIMHTVNSLGQSVDAAVAAALLYNLRETVAPETLELLAAAVDINSLRSIPAENRDEVRAAILKRCLLTVGKYSES